MTAITMEVKVNLGIIIYHWIVKWFNDVAKRKKEGKRLPNMFFGIFINIISKKMLKKHIRDKEFSPYYQQEDNKEAI